MALSFRETKNISERIKANLAKINAGNLGFSQVKTISKAIKDDLALLNGGTVVTPEPEQTLFQQIAKGVHDAMGAVEVFNKIKSEVDRITREVISGDNAINNALLSACIKCADLAENEGIA
jgi:hypothetical protein